MKYDYSFEPNEIIEYLRKSRADDPLDTVEDVLKRHEQILLDWSTRTLNAPIPEENIFREVVSGETIDDRPEMLKVLRMIESPKIKAILVVEVQRLSRGDLEDAGRLIKLLRYTNTVVITPGKIYNLADEYDRDAFEHELKRGNDYLEYTKKILNRGRIQSVMDGNYIGSVPPYGWKKVWVGEGKDKYPTLDFCDETPNLRLMYKLCHDEHMRPATIAHKLDELGIKPRKGSHWSSEAIRGILTNRHNNGKVVWNQRKCQMSVEDQELIKSRPRAKDGDFYIFDGKQPTLVDDIYFNETLEFLKQNSREPFGTTLRNPFAGILYCQCGHAMTLRHYKDSNGKTRCESRYICTDQAHCKTGSCLSSEAHTLFKELLEQGIRDFEFELKNQKESSFTSTQIGLLKKRLETLEKKEISQWEKYSEDGMPKEIFEKLNKKVLDEKSVTQKALAEALKQENFRIDYQNKIYLFKDALNALEDDTLSATDKNRLLKSCINRVIYHREAPVRLTKKEGGFSQKGMGTRWSSTQIHADVDLRL